MAPLGAMINVSSIEMTELVLALLGSEDKLPSRPRWRKPEANHKARWMAKCLHGMKMLVWRFGEE